MMICHLLSSNNNPTEDKITFTSSDHVRFENGKDVHKSPQALWKFGPLDKCTYLCGASGNRYGCSLI